MKSVLSIGIPMVLFAGACSGSDGDLAVDAATSDARDDSAAMDAGSDASGMDAPGVDTAMGSDTSGVDTATENRDACLERARAVEFQASPPAGATKLQGLGDCVDVLRGPELFDYYCVWCHSTLDNNDIQERTLEKTIWAVDLGESVENWPVGELSERDAAIELLYQTLLEAPPAVVDAHPHPLPEHL